MHWQVSIQSKSFNQLWVEAFNQPVRKAKLMFQAIVLRQSEILLTLEKSALCIFFMTK